MPRLPGPACPTTAPRRALAYAVALVSVRLGLPACDAAEEAETTPYGRSEATCANVVAGDGLVQERLAERAGLDRTYVSGVEREVGNPTAQALFRLGWSPAELVGAVAERIGAEDPW